MATKDHIIVVKIRGGLGNQLFQYALGRSVQEKTGYDLVLDTSDFKSDRFHRSFVLNHFLLNDKVSADSSGHFNHIYGGSKHLLIKGFGKIFPRLWYKLLSQRGVYYWDFGTYKPLKVSYSKKRLYFNGYWQSPLYFSNITEILKKEISLKSEPSVENAKRLVDVSQPNAVGVHLRFTDVAVKNSSFNNCTLSYYQKGMEIIEKTISHPIYYVFSDDYVSAKKLFEGSKRTFVFMNTGNNGEEDFRLLRACSNLITANSTYSWWAGVLSSHPNAIIVAPKRRFLNDDDNPLAQMEGWFFLEN